MPSKAFGLTGFAVAALPRFAGSAALALTNTASTASVLLMGGNNSAYSGTVSLSGTAARVFRLTSATAGSSAATWSARAWFCKRRA